MTPESQTEPEQLDAAADTRTKPSDTAELRAAINDTVSDLIPDARSASNATHRDVGGPGGWRKWR